MQEKRKYRYFPVILTVICAAACIACGTNAVKREDPVLKISGQTVVKEEYQMIVKKYKTQVMQQYSTDEVNRKNFWTSDINGKQPLEELMQLAEQDLIQRKVTAAFAKEAEIGIPSDYLSICQQLEDGSAGSDYGLTEYTAEDYYDYICTALESAVMENLKKEYEISPEELKRAYEENISDYTSEISVRLLAAEWEGADTAAVQELADDMRNMAQKQTELEAQTELTALQEKFPEAEIYEITLSSLHPQEGKSGVYWQRWMTASQMQPGEVCEPFLLSGKTMVLYCLDRAQNQTESFEDVSQILESQVRSQRAKEQLAAAAAKASAVCLCEEKELRKIAEEAVH